MVDRRVRKEMTQKEEARVQVWDFHLVNKITNSHFHTSVRMTPIFHTISQRKALCKGSITFRSHDVTLMSGSGQHIPIEMER